MTVAQATLSQSYNIKDLTDAQERPIGFTYTVRDQLDGVTVFFSNSTLGQVYSSHDVLSDGDVKLTTILDGEEYDFWIDLKEKQFYNYDPVLSEDDRVVTDTTDLDLFVTFVRKTAPIQQLDLVQGSPFRAEAAESQLDRTVMVVQEMREVRRLFKRQGPQGGMRLFVYTIHIPDEGKIPDKPEIETLKDWKDSQRQGTDTWGREAFSEEAAEMAEDGGFVLYQSYYDYDPLVDEDGIFVNEWSVPTKFRGLRGFQGPYRFYLYTFVNHGVDPRFVTGATGATYNDLIDDDVTEITNGWFKAFPSTQASDPDNFDIYETFIFLDPRQDGKTPDTPLPDERWATPFKIDADQGPPGPTGPPGPPGLKGDPGEKGDPGTGGGISTVATDDTLKGTGASDSALGLSDALQTAIADNTTEIDSLEERVDDLEGGGTTPTQGGNPAFAKFSVPEGATLADSLNTWKSVTVTNTPVQQLANDDSTINTNTFPTADVFLLKAGLYTFNVSLPVEGLDASDGVAANSRKVVSFRAMRIALDRTMTVISGPNPSTYLRGAGGSVGSGVIGGTGTFLVTEDDTVVAIQTGVPATGGAQTNNALTSAAGGHVEIFRNVEASITGTAVKGDPGTPGTPGAPGRDADLSKIRGGSAITVQHNQGSGSDLTLINVLGTQAAEWDKKVPDGGATAQVLTKKSNNDQDDEWLNVPNIYEYKAGISEDSATGVNLKSTTLMGLNRNVDPSETPAYAGKKVTIPASGSHFNLPAGHWSIYVTTSLGNANVESVQLEVLIDDNVLPGATVDGILDGSGNASFATSFTLSEASEFLFNIISNSASSTISARLNTPAGLIFIREGFPVREKRLLPPGGSRNQILEKAADDDYIVRWVNPPSGSGGDYTAGDGLSLQGREFRLAPLGVGTANIKPDAIVLDHLNAQGSAFPGYILASAGGGEFRWAVLLEHLGVTILRYEIDNSFNFVSRISSLERLLVLGLGATPTVNLGDNSTVTRDSNNRGLILTGTVRYRAYGTVTLDNPNIESITNVSARGFDTKSVSITGLGTHQVIISFATNDRFTSSAGFSFQATFKTGTPDSEKVFNVTSGHIELLNNWDTLVPDMSINDRQLHNSAVQTRALGNKSVTPPKMAPAREWVLNGSNLQRDTTATSNYMMAYKENQALRTDLPEADRPEQWVPVTLDNKFRLLESVQGLTEKGTNFSLDFKEEAVRQQDIRNPLNVDNLIGATVLNPATTTISRGDVYSNTLDNGNGGWTTEAGSAPGITFEATQARFTIARGRQAKLRNMTHILVRIGKNANAQTGGDTLRDIAIDPKASGGNSEGDIMNEVMLPLENPYAPPVPSAINTSGTNRGTGDEHLFYNLGTANFRVGLRITERANGTKIIDVINNGAQVAANTWVSFHAVRGIGG